jgi:hypothetical protein
MKEKKLEILYSGIFKVIFCCFLRIFAEWRSHDRKSGEDEYIHSIVDISADVTN